MIIDCVADLHGEQPKLEGGDLLILAGDYTARDSLTYWTYFFKWLGQQKYRKKIMIAGNHDNFLVDYDPTVEARKCGVTDFEYLCDSGTEFEGLKIYGSPWTAWFHGVNPHCKAFMVSESKLAQKWAKIPTNLDILVTHSPPFSVLDRSSRGELCGSPSLLKKIEEIKPKLCVFGHIHEGHGQLVYKRPGIGVENNTMMVNCSYLDGDYIATNKPVRIVL